MSREIDCSSSWPTIYLKNYKFTNEVNCILTPLCSKLGADSSWLFSSSNYTPEYENDYHNFMFTLSSFCECLKGDKNNFIKLFRGWCPSL